MFYIKMMLLLTWTVMSMIQDLIQSYNVLKNVYFVLFFHQAEKDWQRAGDTDCDYWLLNALWALSAVFSFAEALNFVS